MANKNIDSFLYKSVLVITSLLILSGLSIYMLSDIDNTMATLDKNFKEYQACKLSLAHKLNVARAFAIKNQKNLCRDKKFVYIKLAKDKVAYVTNDIVVNSDSSESRLEYYGDPVLNKWFDFGAFVNIPVCAGVGDDGELDTELRWPAISIYYCDR